MGWLGWLWRIIMDLTKKQMNKIKRIDKRIDSKYTDAAANRKKFKFLKKFFSREGMMLEEYLNYLQEGWADTALVAKRQAQLANYHNKQKECKKLKDPSKVKSCQRKWQDRIDSWKLQSRHVIQREAGFEDKPKGWTDKSIKKYLKTFGKDLKKVKEQVETILELKATSKGFFDACVKKMKGKMESPEGFCASLKDEAEGSTYWRGKGKTKKEADKDTRKHQNV